MVGPAEMKADLVAQINALTNKALADPGLKARYADLGASPMPTTPAEMKAFREAEEARLLPIMKAAGIKPEGGCAVIPRRMRGSSTPQLLGSITDASARRAAHD